MFEAYELGIKHEFPVVLGSEFYFEGLKDERKLGHLILLAKNNKGFENLFRIQKEAYDNMYYKPRVNMDMLNKYNEGLICTTACVANQISRCILNNDIVNALAHLIDLKQIFGDDLYIEVQSREHKDQKKVNEQLLKWSKEYKIKPIITTDIHYVNEEDSVVHEVLLAIQQQKKMSDKNRWHFEDNEYWLKTEEEMKRSVPYISNEDFNECFKNTCEIVDKCHVTIERKDHLPKFLPTKEEEDEALHDLTMQKYLTRIKDRGECNDEFYQDLHKELDVIKETGYSGYFMIVQEYINWAKQNGILVGDGRGSGCGSKVVYDIGITEVNPQKYDLLFERFLSIGREPDIDSDFSDINAVFEHLQDRYGKDNVARVGAFNRFTCKSATRKVMSIYGFPQQEITKIVKMMPDRLHFTLEEAMNENKDFKKFMETHHNIYLCVNRFENIMSHLSTHAGGVVICEDLAGKLPLMKQSEDKDKWIIALDKHIVEDLNHYKFDILGLNSLSLLKDTQDFTGIIDWSKVDFDDEKVYDMLCSGNVLGVFQLSEQQQKVMEQQPRNFDDLIAINALVRPGVADWSEYIARRTGKTEYDCYGSYLESTHGLIVYQEQYLLLANQYAGWELAYSDKHIRKNNDIVNDIELKAKFINDGIQLEHSVELLEEIWNEIVNIVSGGYGFNKSHATSYAVIAFQTAYLKCYYPKEFYSAYLSMNVDDGTEIRKIKNELNKLHIKLLPPDINTSTDKFKPVNDGIQLALNSIKGVGGSVLYEVNRLKPIISFEDFMKRRIPKMVRITSLQALIKAGAFDFDNDNRYELLLKLDENATKQSNANYEKEAYGFYVTESPCDDIQYKSIDDVNASDVLTTVGEITSIREIRDKNGNEMAFVTAVNSKDILNLVVFASVWKNTDVQENDFVLIIGKKDRTSLLVNKLERLEV